MLLKCCTQYVISLSNEVNIRNKNGNSALAPGWRAVGYGNPGELLCRVARSLGFYGDVMGCSLANHSNPASFLVAHALLGQDGC